MVKKAFLGYKECHNFETKKLSKNSNVETELTSCYNNILRFFDGWANFPSTTSDY